MSSSDVVDDSFEGNLSGYESSESQVVKRSLENENLIVDDTLNNSHSTSSSEDSFYNQLKKTPFRRGRRPVIASDSEDEFPPDCSGSAGNNSFSKLQPAKNTVDSEDEEDVIDNSDSSSCAEEKELHPAEEHQTLNSEKKGNGRLRIDSEDENAVSILSVNSTNETKSNVIELSSSDEESNHLIEMNEVRGKKSMVQPTLEALVKNLSVAEQKVPEKNNNVYCSSGEYSNQATKVANIRTDLQKCRNILRTVAMESLPDKGALLRQRQQKLEQELLKEEILLKNMVVTVDDSQKKEGKKLTWEQLQANSSCVVPKTLGKQAMATHISQKSLTMDRLKNLHNSLATCPGEEVLAEDPKGLRVELMKHQKRALAWLIWREGQKPPGGILADDMGLGKTLTMISVVLQTKEINFEDSDSESETEGSPQERNKASKWIHNKTKVDGGTLVICPASLINQWQGEVEKRLKRHLLTVELYHGNSRETNASRLGRYDIVISTYKLVMGDYAKKGPLFRIRWKRIILDEAHTVRNHKSQTSVAVCDLSGKARWALTGTPVHNKELDLYALLKFLKCSPFDDLAVWKHWVANKNAGGQDRLNTVISSVMLRRTKAQLQVEGTLADLPEKKFETIQVELDSAEKKIYQKVLIFSRTLFIEFLRQRESNNPNLMFIPGGGFTQTNDEDYNKMYKKVQKMHGTSDVKSHEILVLLLRLRQICCHASLISSMLDNEICEEDGIEEDGVDVNVLDKLMNLNLDDDDEEDNNKENDKPAPEKEDLNTATNKLLSLSNPVFAGNRPNAKLNIIQKIIEEKVFPQGDKIIIVSQWTSMLKIIHQHLKSANIHCDALDGSVPVMKRGEIVSNFNNPNHKSKVLLLSLTAGGVGLNLIGANHLLLIDLHWNPQLEAQAQDRIYRVGQRKTVFVYKLVTLDTIEERILELQNNKLAMAEDILMGTRAAGATKLTMNDLKLLFSIDTGVQT